MDFKFNPSIGRTVGRGTKAGMIAEVLESGDLGFSERVRGIVTEPAYIAGFFLLLIAFAAAVLK